MSVATARATWGACCTIAADEARFPWFRFILGIFIAGQTMVFGLAINLTPPESELTRLLLQGGMLAATLLVMAMLGWPLLKDAVFALRERRLTMEMLFVLGIAGSFALSLQSILRGSGPVYFEVVAALLIIYSAGRAISARSQRRALEAIRRLAEGLGRVRRVEVDGTETEVGIESVGRGDLVRVLPGEWIPVDGRIVEGRAFVRETPFTGEWLSTVRGPRDAVMAGTVSEDGALLVEATAAGGRRRVDLLAELIEEARLSPTSLQRQADRFVRWFLPLVAAVALCTFLYWMPRSGAQQGLFHALAVLLVACPCAAGLATPLVLWTLLGKLAREGLVLRSGDSLERLAAVDSVLFDKTGTLGDERLFVEEICARDRERTLATVAAVERRSTHPVARALQSLPVSASAPAVSVHALRTLPGLGVEAEVSAPDARRVRIVREPGRDEPGRLRLRVDIDGEWAATIFIRERLRDTARKSIEALRDQSLNVRILTGDGWAGAHAVLDLAETEAELTPEQKHRAVESLRGGEPGYARPLFVGDGLNDAAAMAASHVSIALAGGSSVAAETASATLHGDDLTLIPRAVGLARHAVRIIRSNLHWAVAYNLLGILAAATGHLHPVVAVLLMACSSAFVSWRSFRLAKPPALPRRAATREERIRPGRGVLRMFGALHVAGMLGQGWLLAILAGRPVPGTLAAFAAAAVLLLAFWRRMPPWLDMIFAMVTLGGLGMNFGWWMDFGFQPAVGGCPHCSPEQSSLWMNTGMLLLGVPAMFLVRHTWERFRWRKWCCGGMVVLGIPGMLLGMLAGSVIAAEWLPGAVVGHYLLMMLGMCLGMLLPHALEFALPRRARS